MYLLEETQEEYSWNYGKYPKEHFHQICVQVISILWLLLHERMTIMKSWLSNLFHPSSTVVPPTSSDAPGATLNFTRQSQPVVNRAMDYYLPLTRHFGESSNLVQHPLGTHCAYSNPNVYQDKFKTSGSASTVFEDLVKQASPVTLCKRNTTDFPNLLWLGNSMAFLASSLGDACKGLPEDHQYSCSAPSVLCVRETESKRLKSGSLVGDRLYHHKPSGISDLLEGCTSKVEDHPVGVKQADPAMFPETIGIDASAESNYASCSNPLIAYILGLDGNCDYSDESDDDFDVCFPQGNDRNYEIALEDDPWNHLSESTEKSLTLNMSCQSSENESESSHNSRSCESDILVPDTSEENSSLVSSFSDYWSDDSDCVNSFLENQVENFPNLQKPCCSNPHINYILNMEDDSDVDKLDYQPEQKTCNDKIWKDSLKSDDEFCVYSGSKATGQCKSPFLQKCAKKRSVCKVHFDESPPTIHHMIAWSFAYKQSRCGPWESHARDRERFRIRIMNVESAISWCFLPQHREAVWEDRIASIWDE